MEVGQTGRTEDNVARSVSPQEFRYGAGHALNQLLNTRGGTALERTLMFVHATSFPVRNWRNSIWDKNLIKYLKFPGPIDGGWSEWSWPEGECFPKSDSHPLKVTSQSGQRTCTRPEPQHGGQNCTGEETKMRECYSYGEWQLAFIGNHWLFNGTQLSRICFDLTILFRAVSLEVSLSLEWGFW